MRDATQLTCTSTQLSKSTQRAQSSVWTGRVRTSAHCTANLGVSGRRGAGMGRPDAKPPRCIFHAFLLLMADGKLDLMELGAD